jgi:uncharacterized protein involved in exopolysaccharide biosynthesis
MNLFDSLRVLLKRWYLTLPGVLLSLALAVGAWVTVSPTYTRTASLLLLPASSSLGDDGTGNPYLYMSGLSQAADVLVRAVNSQQNLDEIHDQYPGATVTVARDPSTITPVVTIDVEVADDAQAGAVLSDVLGRATSALTELQAQESIPASNRIGVQTLTSDTTSTASNKKRVTFAGGAAVGGLVLAIVAIIAVDGLLGARSGGGRPRRLKAVADAEADPDTGADAAA